MPMPIPRVPPVMSTVRSRRSSPGATAPYLRPMAAVPEVPDDWVDRPFDADRLTADIDDGSLHEAMAVAVAALEDEADLTPLGRWATHRYLDRVMGGRRALDAWRRTESLAEHAAADLLPDPGLFEDPDHPLPIRRAS